MAKYTKKQKEEVKRTKSSTANPNVEVGFGKFENYARPREIYLRRNTHGEYKVRHNGGEPSKKYCVRGVKDENGNLVRGWVIDFGHRRTFEPDGTGWEVFPLKKK